MLEKPGQEAERSFSSKCSLRIRHVRAQLSGSRRGCMEAPNFCLVLFNRDKTTHGMVKKPPNREKSAERRCRVARGEKLQTKPGSGGIKHRFLKKPHDTAEHIPAPILGGKRSCYGSTVSNGCSKTHFFSGIAPSGKMVVLFSIHPPTCHNLAVLPGELFRHRLCHRSWNKLNIVTTN